MKILGAGIPLFLGQGGVGQNFGQIAPQIRFFDVYYIHPPVVGLQIIGSESP